ncbi:hypothetical protein MX850_11385 [Erysipelothrix sp. Poltava]|nr:hypothetical protein MX850_11385 [Erysipelothrix sp. Poltava]
MTRSILDEVSGLGKVRQKELYKKFGSLKNIRAASLETLQTVLPEDVAGDLYDILHIDWNDYHEKN